MPRRSPNAPPMDAIERDFMEALQRLCDGVPREKSLQLLKARGRLKVSMSSVAMEARRSRTLIALESPKYPRVRELVRLAMDGRQGEPRTSNDLIDKLREIVAALRTDLKRAEAQTTAHFIARERAEKELMRVQDKYDRLVRKRASPEVADDNVVQLQPRS